MRIIELKDVILLLRSEVARAGGQVAWSKKTGIHRVRLNRVLNGHVPPTKAMLSALKLRTVIVSSAESPNSK